MTILKNQTDETVDIYRDWYEYIPGGAKKLTSHILTVFLPKSSSKMGLDAVRSVFHNATEKYTLLKEDDIGPYTDDYLTNIFRLSGPLAIGSRVYFGNVKFSMKRGTTSLSFTARVKLKIMGGSYVRVPPSNNYMFINTLNSSDISIPTLAEYHHLYEINGPVAVRSRQANGAYILIGNANTEDQLRKLVDEAEKRSGFKPGMPEGFEFIADTAEIVTKHRRTDSYPIYQDLSTKYLSNKTWTVVKYSRGFRNLGIIGIVSVKDDLRIVPIEGGDSEPYFMAAGEIEALTSYTTRVILINRDCTRYWYTRLVNGVPLVNQKKDKSINPLTESDKSIAMAAIGEYLKSLQGVS